MKKFVIFAAGFITGVAVVTRELSKERLTYTNQDGEKNLRYNSSQFRGAVNTVSDN